MGVFDPIISALQGQTAKADPGTLNKVGIDKRKIDMSPREATMAKLHALGLSSMPDGGQQELDQMWGDHVKRVNGAK
jgi:hypothetical protein